LPKQAVALHPRQLAGSDSWTLDKRREQMRTASTKLFTIRYFKS